MNNKKYNYFGLPQTLSKKQALKILREHSVLGFESLKDFIFCEGNRTEYKTSYVFAWLGY